MEQVIDPTFNGLYPCARKLCTSKHHNGVRYIHTLNFNRTVEVHHKATRNSLQSWCRTCARLNERRRRETSTPPPPVKDQ